MLGKQVIKTSLVEEGGGEPVELCNVNGVIVFQQFRTVNCFS